MNKCVILFFLTFIVLVFYVFLVCCWIFVTFCLFDFLSCVCVFVCSVAFHAFFMFYFDVICVLICISGSPVFTEVFNNNYDSH